MSDKQQNKFTQAAADTDALRKRAEERARNMEPTSLSAQTPEEIRNTLHELRVHQIELEMQNEELRTAQAEIESGRARYFDLYDLAPVGYCTLSEKGLILEANLTVAALLEMNRSTLIKQPISRFILKEDQDIFYLHCKKLFETGQPQECELRLLKSDGTFFWVHLTSTADQAEDGAPECRVVLSDIDERKRAEEEKEKLQAQLVQARKMESVGRLAGGVAHDFNNMLSVILGNTEMAMEGLAPNEPLYNKLNEISSAAKRSADITRQLLAFAREQIIVPQELDLNRTLNSMLKMLRQLIGEDIDLIWLPKEDLWPIRIDPSQIDQILTNLCINAQDAIADVGKLTIETGKATFDEAYCADHPGFVPGDFVQLTVSDNGCGMNKETLQNLFEPFYTTKDVNKGTGLGLATVYGIVKQNGGFIKVYSEPDLGTTFRIYLPRYLAESKILKKKPADTITLDGTETILLVEDEPSILRMTRMMLERMGYKVLTAGTPVEAITLAREHAGEIHLLMTDVVMPEMNGRDLAENILSLYPNLKRLFTSGYTANVIAHHGVLAKGVQFIQKPFSKQDLAIKVREVLDEAE